LVRPFFKPNGVDVRPILCAEALLKFAVGSCIRTTDTQLAAAMGDRQFGAGRAGGVYQEVGEVRAAARLRPNDALASLDIKNAFGSVRWVDALRAVLKAVPKLAPLLAIQWHSMELKLWLQKADGQTWHMLIIHGSLLQGGLDGHPVFCLVVSVVLGKIRNDGRISAYWLQISIWAYVDDLLMQCPPQLLRILIAVVTDVLATFQLQLQHGKSCAHIPAQAGKPLTEWPEEARVIEGVLPISINGIVILGTEAAGDLDLPLGPWAEAAEKTRARAAKACQLADATMQLISRPPPAGGKHVAWRICRNVLTHALDYDCRVLTSSLVLPHATVVEERAWGLVEAIVGHQLTSHQKQQVQLPTVMGGCQMPMPIHMVPLARAADLIESGTAVRQAVVGWGFDLETARTVDGVDIEIAHGLLEKLSDQSITFQSPGIPCVLDDSHRAAENPDMLRPASARRNTLSTLLNVAATAVQAELLQTDSREATRLHSAGGANAGKSLVAPAGHRLAQFTDDQLTEILRWRLGITAAQDMPRCQNFSEASGDTCGEMLDAWGDHAVGCRCGPLRIRRHNNIADHLADMVECTGAHTRREAYVKEFSKAGVDAYLDVWAFGGVHVEDLLIDVTIRHPASARYQPRAAQQSGWAAECAERDKEERYPAAGGRSVWTFALETWGRLGTAGEELLQFIAAEAVRHARRRGHVVTAGSFLRQWRATVDASLQKGVAAALISARCGLPGHAHHKRWNLSDV